MGFGLGVLGSLAFFAVRGPTYVAVTLAVLAVSAIGVWWASTRRLVLGFAAGWLTPAVAVLGLFLWWSGAIGDYFLSGSFDAETWRAKHAAPFSDRTRLRMVEDLRRSGRLDGLTRAQVLDLLGPPSGGASSDVLRWTLGPDGIGIDSLLLVIRLRANDTVESHGLGQS
jgi:hypothetical protein